MEQETAFSLEGNTIAAAMMGDRQLLCEPHHI